MYSKIPFVRFVLYSKKQKKTSTVPIPNNPYTPTITLTIPKPLPNHQYIPAEPLLHPYQTIPTRLQKYQYTSSKTSIHL